MNYGRRLTMITAPAAGAGAVAASPFSTEPVNARSTREDREALLG